MESSGKDVDSRRIGIFQAQWPLQSQTANCAAAFSQAGYEVDLFLYRADAYVELEPLRSLSRTHLHLFEVEADAGSHCLFGLFNSGVKAYRLLRGRVGGLVPPKIVNQALKLMEKKSYRCLIGVEKKGLIWAGQVAEQLKIPFLYYSLELYTDDFQPRGLMTRMSFKRLRQTERAYHRRAYATIIQDPARAKVLFEANHLSEESIVYYLPVSLLGETYGSRSRFLHQIFNIHEDSSVILYFGQIWEQRYVLELARVAQNFPENWVLVMHGEDYGNAVAKIRSLDYRRKVLISTDMVPSCRLQEIVASADVGLALYSNSTQNDQLTAFSSEKMALYMQCGVPFIAFDYPGYRQLANEDECGAVVRNLEELPVAIGKILLSHETFRRGAYRAFQKHYNFASNFSRVIEGIQSLRARAI
jgi:glycosyltransferase involved in cell wall biosynthesis